MDVRKKILDLSCEQYDIRKDTNSVAEYAAYGCQEEYLVSCLNCLFEHLIGRTFFCLNFYMLISVFHLAFFNAIIDKHQHMHFTFNNIRGLEL